MIISYKKHAKNPGFNVTQDVFHDEAEAHESHEAEPLKNVDDILKVANYLKENNRLRDHLLFLSGINFGYRCGDLVSLKIGHFIDQNGWTREKITLREEKTEKSRTVYINDVVEDAVMLFLQGKDVDLDDYMFQSRSRTDTAKYYDNIKTKVRVSEERKKESENYVVRHGAGGPISVRSVHRILTKVINDECGIDIHVGTHTLRKTFAYHALMSASDRSRALELVQKMLNHSSPSITMRYIGITEDEIRGVYKNLNLGKESDPVGGVNNSLRMFIA